MSTIQLVALVFRVEILKGIAKYLSNLYGFKVDFVDNYDKEPFGCYCYRGKEIELSIYCHPAILLHEVGHHLNYLAGGWDYCQDDILAWDTAKSLAIEVGYEWSLDDDQWLKEGLEGYSFQFINGKWSSDDSCAYALYAPMSK